MATIYKRGPAWYINWTESGRRHQKSLGKITESAAETQKLALERRLAGTQSAAGPAFASWAEQYAEWHVTEYPDSYFRIEQILRTHLIPTFGQDPLMLITRQVVENYKHTRLKAGAAPGTVTKELRTIQAILNKAAEWDVIARNPAAGVKAPRDLASAPPRWYSSDELRLIYRTQANIHPSTPKDDRVRLQQYRWSWQLLANSGMRRGEAMHLRWRDVGAEEIRIVSGREARTKSGKWRLVPVTKGSREAIEELRGERQFVLPRVRPESLSRSFDKTLRRADLNGSIHCLRHSYCSHLVQAGVPLRTVQVLAGHASFITTERYAHLAPGHLKEMTRGLNI